VNANDLFCRDRKFDLISRAARMYFDDRALASRGETKTVNNDVPEKLHLAELRQSCRPMSGPVGCSSLA
jgi:hypothetical protein